MNDEDRDFVGLDYEQSDNVGVFNKNMLILMNRILKWIVEM